MRRRRWTGHFQNLISSAERVCNSFSRRRIGNPFAVHDEAVFVGAGRKGCFLPPIANAGGIESLGFGLPMIKCSRDTNSLGRRMSKFKTNGHKLWTDATGVVMIMIVFHVW